MDYDVRLFLIIKNNRKGGHMTEVELLSPAGSIQTLYSAVNAGADAIYIGGQKFGARAYAENPDTEDFLRGMDYVHLHNRKLYLTVNTLLKNKELEEELYEYLLPFYREGLDAVIVQDLGVFKFIRENFPGMDIHASTQMGISSKYSAEMLKNMGASRVVTARELSLKEIETIHKSVDIEIESFIHGAMCYSYSGMCLFSSIAGGRSGNRGRCAGPCRQPYEVFSDDRRLNNKNSLYALSLKDMNTLTILPEIINAGVYSLKIEGRMKSPEYAAGVVSVYRKYLDRLLSSDKEYFIEKQDLNNLNGLYSRSGSGTGYYKCHNSEKMISYEKPAYKTEDMDFIDKIREEYCNGDSKINIEGEIYLEPEKESVLKLRYDDFEIEVKGEKVDRALNRPLDVKNVQKQLYKTGDVPVKFSKLNININGDIFMPVKAINELRRQGINKLLDKILESYKRDINLGKNSDVTAEIIKNSPRAATKKSIYCGIFKEEQLRVVCEKDEVAGVYIYTDGLTVKKAASMMETAKNAGKDFYIGLPAIFREKDISYFEKLKEYDIYYEAKGFVARNVDELAYVIALNDKEQNMREIIADGSLYHFNNEAYNVLINKGCKRITLPYELNYKEFFDTVDECSELIVYGHIPLMYTSNCVHKNYEKCDGISKIITLKDRLGYEFRVENYCDFCYNTIYNHLPMSLLGVSQKVNKLNINHLRLNFTLESGKDTKVILDGFIRAYCYGEDVSELEKFTRGHFNRGVD